MRYNGENKVVIISGSSKGIGKGLAIQYLENNFKVMINSRNYDELKTTYLKLKKKFKNEILMVSGDISNKNTLKEIRKIILKKWKKIDILIANAGDVSKKNEKSAWYIDKNYLVTKKFIDFFYKDLIKTSGNIILISSIVSLTNTPAPKGFTKSKKLINKYGRSLSLKLAKFNVNVNVIAPGNIYFRDGNWDNKMRKNPKETKKYINNQVPMQKFGTIRDISNLCLFLTSKFSSFITGQTIAVDGGQAIKK